MTTTLRPTGPEQLAADGTRTRAYDICVNSRPVGGLRLRTGTAPGEAARVPAPVGRIDRLTVAPADRGRGRATVALLAAEEVLRGWGCTRVWSAVPADAEAALHLAAALGHRPVNLHLSKALHTPPGLPEGSAATPLTQEELPDLLARAHDTFVTHCVAAGLDRGFAEAKSRTDLAALLPDGTDTAGTVLRALRHRGEPVGALWLGYQEAGTRCGFVEFVSVAPAHRRQGHGRTLMLLAERACLAAGVHRLDLDVLAANTPARALYAALGYEPLLIHFHKPL